MRSRLFRILFVAFQAVWLNAVVPGHTRGVVTIGTGPGVATTEAASCHVARPASHRCCPIEQAKKDGAKKDDAPTSEQKGRCAVCVFAARVTPPPVFDLAPPAMALLCVRPIAAPEL